jgi:predicted nucleic acid-binding protein
MGDIVLDTNIVADFLAIYFERSVSIDGLFYPKYRINQQLCERINLVINEYRYGPGVFSKGLIVASSFSFVEIARKFDVVVYNRFSIEQFKAFIDSAPEWFLIEPVTPDLFLLFNEVPERVDVGEGVLESIEWSDAIHVVTALSRGGSSLLCTTDHRIKKIPSIVNRIL